MAQVTMLNLEPILRAEGIDLWGVCAAQSPPHLPAYAEWVAQGNHGSMGYLADHLPLKSHPEHLLPGVKSILAIALNYNQDPPQNPKIARYALGRDYHKVLRSKLKRIQANLSDGSHRICVDSAPLLERDFAQLAGIGWFGKNTMIINSRRGSWFVLGFLLTTLDLPRSQPAEGGCGTCTRCIDACPTGAIVQRDGRWQVDARRCISCLTIEHKGPFTEEQERMVGDWTFGCDVCQEVCPFNQPRETQPNRATITSEPEFKSREWPDLVHLTQIDQQEWDEITRGSPLRRAWHDGLKRNAQANLINRKRID
jgi:epoxyqueuosine reductase